MSSFTIQAETVIDSVIQDGQVQTTNRTALLDYVNRVSLRILRESQWAFLKSKPQKFITDVGVTKYWVGSGPPPAGALDTGLQIANLGTIVPESVYDLSNNHHLAEVSPTILNRASLRFQDGSFRIDRPRNYWFEFDSGGLLTLVPPPAGTNQYQPVPLPPVCSYVVGGYLPKRTYAVTLTYVDSNFNEGQPSAYNTVITVPANNLLVVQPPAPEVSSATSVTYDGWNVYVGSTSVGSSGQPTVYLQNRTPMSQASSYQEPLSGVPATAANPYLPLTGYVTVPDTLGGYWQVGISTSGQLTATQSGPVPLNMIYLSDSAGTLWTLGLNATGQLFAASLPATFPAEPPPPYLVDSAGTSWQLTIGTNGYVQATAVGPASGYTTLSRTPPKVSSLAPLLGYVIQFEYMQQRIPITTSTQYLQVPFQYQDVVIAGVNYYANLYTAKADDEGIKAGAWKKEFMDGLAQIRRDLRISSRTVDYLAPDRTSQRSDGVDWNIILYN